MSTITKDQVIEWLSSQSVLQLNELVKELETKWGVSAAAVAAAPAAGAAAAPADPAADRSDGPYGTLPRPARDWQLAVAA